MEREDKFFYQRATEYTLGGLMEIVLVLRWEGMS
jgi:hypothetical protein